MTRRSPESKRNAPRVSLPTGEVRVSDPGQRPTVEVRPSWLEPEKAGPPPLAAAAADRDTLEVRQTWIQIEPETPLTATEAAVAAAAADLPASTEPSGEDDEDAGERVARPPPLPSQPPARAPLEEPAKAKRR